MDTSLVMTAASLTQVREAVGMLVLHLLIPMGTGAAAGYLLGVRYVRPFALTVLFMVAVGGVLTWATDLYEKTQQTETGLWYVSWYTELAWLVSDAMSEWPVIGFSVLLGGAIGAVLRMMVMADK